jgi:hypothetical protein
MTHLVIAQNQSVTKNRHYHPWVRWQRDYYNLLVRWSRVSSKTKVFSFPMIFNGNGCVYAVLVNFFDTLIIGAVNVDVLCKTKPN